MGTLARMSRTGQKLVDIPEATVQILVDLPEMVATFARLQPEGGPPLHIHHVQADTFAVLAGALAVSLGSEERELGAGVAWTAPPEVPHTYRHEAGGEVRFVNVHTPGMNFADYLFGEKTAEEIDQVDPPEDGARPASDAIVLDFAEQGEVVTDKPERTIRILTDLPSCA